MYMSEGEITPEEPGNIEQGKNYSELRHSVERLGEVVPNMVDKLTHDDQEETVILPKRWFDTTERNAVTDWTVAISDENIRIFNFIPPREERTFGNHSVTFYTSVEPIFKDIAANNGSEEQVVEAIRQKKGLMFSSEMDEDSDPEKAVMQALYLRVEALAMREYGDNFSQYVKNENQWDVLAKGLDFEFPARMGELMEPVPDRLNKLTDQVQQLRQTQT